MKTKTLLALPVAFLLCLPCCSSDESDEPNGRPTGVVDIPGAGDVDGGAEITDASKLPADASKPEGDGGKPRTCQGTTWSCSLRGASQCLESLGCWSKRTCSGFASSCYAMYSSYACNAQEGCYWSSYNSECSGSAWSCSLLSSSTSCNSQAGCSWKDECSGYATPCSLLSSSNCLSQPGCSLK